MFSHLLAKVNGSFTSPPAMILAPRPPSPGATAAVACLMNPVIRGSMPWISHTHHVSSPLPVLVKFEAYACLRNATLPSPMSSVRDPVSCASSTDFLSIQRKCVSSLALVPLGHPWPCVVGG